MPTTYDPRDVRILLAHSRSTVSGAEDRTIELTVEHAATMDPLLRVEMSPLQFAAIMASHATVVRSEIDVPPALTSDAREEWFRPGDRVHPRAGGPVRTVAAVQLIEGSNRQQFRPDGSTFWLHSDEYRLDTSKPSGPMCTLCAGHTVWDGKTWQHLDRRTAFHKLGEHRVTFVPQTNRGPLCTRCLTPTTWNDQEQWWDHLLGWQTSDRACTREEHAVTFVPQIGPQWLEVTLTRTTNEYLTVPCRGQVQVAEYSTDGRAVVALFRRYNADGTLCAPVRVANPEWVYAKTAHPRTVACPDPAEHGCVVSANQRDELGDCDGDTAAYAVEVPGTFGRKVGAAVRVCRWHADNTPPGSLTRV